MHKLSLKVQLLVKYMVSFPLFCVFIKTNSFWEHVHQHINAYIGAIKGAEDMQIKVASFCIGKVAYIRGNRRCEVIMLVCANN